MLNEVTATILKLSICHSDISNLKKKVEMSPDIFVQILC